MTAPVLVRETPQICGGLVVELERTSERGKDLVGWLAVTTPLESEVVRRADSGKAGDFFPPESLYTPTGLALEANIFGEDQGPAGAEVFPELRLRSIHGSRLSRLMAVVSVRSLDVDDPSDVERWSTARSAEPFVEEPVRERNRHRTLTDCGGDAFHGPVADITRSERARDAGLQVVRGTVQRPHLTKMLGDEVWTCSEVSDVIALQDGFRSEHRSRGGRPRLER
ncbi:hypothetical protein ORG22_08425 [Curtobacterium flaccumfaciens pv. flaccumfaciens]|nr:hypothetical protein [Curtobacterium flaccumfaciens]MCS5495162.1 hypothetical protein [Curtobacterium flaccumfaciens pv. flaccumfaciens]MCX2798190.1 hypothetical protein [Curtobacterium flaccumfaciens pv. flaccumfaciens]